MIIRFRGHSLCSMFLNLPADVPKPPKLKELVPAVAFVLGVVNENAGAGAGTLVAVLAGVAPKENPVFPDEPPNENPDIFNESRLCSRTNIYL